MTNKSGKFLKDVEDIFLTQMITDPMRKDALLDLLVNKEGLMGDVMVGRATVITKYLSSKFFGVMRKMASRVATLAFKRANFKLFREQLSRVPRNLLLRA